MIMRRIAIVLPLLALAACGGAGGESGGVESILALPGGGGTTGTGNNPIGASGANASLAGTLVSEAFSTYASRTVRNTQANNTSTVAASTTAFGTVNVSYNAANNSYTVGDAGTNTTGVFLAGDIRETNQNHVRYTNTAPNRADTLVLFRPGTNNVVPLTYVSYGLWTQSTTATPSQIATRAFIYGVQTPGGNMPRTGSGSYTGLVDGFWNDGATRYRISSSTGTFAANFASGEVATSVTINGAPVGTSASAGAATATLGTVAGRGTLTSGTSLFNGSMAGVNYSGQFSGAFYGPTASEVGMSFTLNGPQGDQNVSGVFVGSGSVTGPAPAAAIAPN